MPSFTDKFAKEDSFAYWPVPEGDDLSTQLARNDAFKAAYRPGFPAEIRAALAKLTPSEWQAKMAAVRYVLVGLNPGNKGASGNFNNFHGDPASKDANLAAVLYGTAVWGTFMTDLSQTVESDSAKVKITAADVAALYAHLHDLGIPQTATIIAMHSHVRTALKRKSAQRLWPFDATTQYIHHYSYRMSSAEDTSQNNRAVIEALTQHQ